MKKYKVFFPIFVLTIILCFSLILMTFKIEKLMIFIGDFGWFYLAARDMLLIGVVPLVSIPSSHPWLHQGPYWTYLLALGLYFFDYHPLIGAYISIFFGILSICGLYFLGKEMFGTKMSLISTMLYATSPLVIVHARMPYHTSPIPFFVICYMFCFYKWVNGQTTYLPFVFLFLGILYNFELAAVILFAPVIGVFLHSFAFKRKIELSKKTVLISVILFFVSMFPIIIYDLSHGFPQTFKFIAWMGYRVLRIFGFPSIHGESGDDINNSFFVSYSLTLLQRLIFLAHGWIAIVVLIVSSLVLMFDSLKKNKYEKYLSSQKTLLILFSIPFLGYVFNRTPSEAYIPLFFPSIFLLLGYTFTKFLNSKSLRYVTGVVFISLIISNPLHLMRQNYFMGSRDGGYGVTFTQRMGVVQIIEDISLNKEVQLIGKGKGSEFESYLMGYEYLLWWQGVRVSKEKNAQKIILEEKGSQILLEIEGKASKSAMLQ